MGVTANNPENSAKQQRTSMRRWLLAGVLVTAAVLLIVSINFPYWRMVLEAPQYPGGLEMRVFINRVTGDEDPTLDEVSEIDGLNHYIGMRSLYEAAEIERAIALPALIAMVIALLAAAVLRWRWLWLVHLPPLGFPFVFLADLAFWLNDYGQNLDPAAPLSSAIRPFTPPILGEGVIGQFKTVASMEAGWWLAVGAAGLSLIGLLLRLWSRRGKA